MGLKTPVYDGETNILQRHKYIRSVSKGTNYAIIQIDKIDRLEYGNSQKSFNIQRALARYVDVNIGPVICAQIQLIAPGNRATTPAEYKSLMKTTKSLTETKSQGL